MYVSHMHTPVWLQGQSTIFKCIYYPVTNIYTSYVSSLAFLGIFAKQRWGVVAGHSRNQDLATTTTTRRSVCTCRHGEDRILVPRPSSLIVAAAIVVVVVVEAYQRRRSCKKLRVRILIRYKKKKTDSTPHQKTFHRPK
jgi:hypothetical protein